jgi:hypothetical protein
LVLYEQWRDLDALNAHLGRLRQVFGPPDDEEPYLETHHRRRRANLTAALGFLRIPPRARAAADPPVARPRMGIGLTVVGMQRQDFRVRLNEQG